MPIALSISNRPYHCFLNAISNSPISFFLTTANFGFHPSSLSLPLSASASSILHPIFPNILANLPLPLNSSRPSASPTIGWLPIMTSGWLESGRERRSKMVVRRGRSGRAWHGTRVGWRDGPCSASSWLRRS